MPNRSVWNIKPGLTAGRRLRIGFAYIAPGLLEAGEGLADYSPNVQFQEPLSLNV